ncbi:hypothetical protein QNI16_14705 [Cytophagaceae bacterium YF14B1]|uniref:Uncharacterized protein n=1 Tax=Xanthocytophaga flava TaxID=3048013 RepID=A0AAE3QSA4_9BACT|nr:hypothetical protein [Xanthocytophaga flavus]MDJ1481748.1 hypothetical protein [Xanthocytophaga flavus]
MTIHELTIYFQPDKGLISFEEGVQLATLSVSDNIKEKVMLLCKDVLFADSEDAGYFLHETCLLFDTSLQSDHELTEAELAAGICVLTNLDLQPFGLFQRRNLKLFNPQVCKGSEVFKHVFQSLQYIRSVRHNASAVPDFFCQN